MPIDTYHLLLNLCPAWVLSLYQIFVSCMVQAPEVNACTLGTVIPILSGRIHLDQNILSRVDVCYYFEE